MVRLERLAVVKAAVIWPSVISDIAREVMRRYHGEVLTPALMTRVALELNAELYDQLWFEPLPAAADFGRDRGVPYFCHESLTVAAGRTMSEGIIVDRASSIAQVLTLNFAPEWNDITQPMAVAIARREGSHGT